MAFCRAGEEVKGDNNSVLCVAHSEIALNRVFVITN